MSTNPEIVFYCWRCGQKFAVPGSLQGEPLTCPACECRLTVPSEEDFVNQKKPVPIGDPLVATENDLIFNCEHCNWEIIMDKRGAGMIVTCPGCGELIEVPQPPKASPRVHVDINLEPTGLV
jgi:DNA-directed RNA polymerase subunit RPC12/RpoP